MAFAVVLAPGVCQLNLIFMVDVKFFKTVAGIFAVKDELNSSIFCCIDVLLRLIYCEEGRLENKNLPFGTSKRRT